MKRLGSVLGGLVPGVLLAVSFFWITSQLTTAQGGRLQASPAAQRREIGAAINGTIITGPIEFDTTWTIGGSPYVIVGDDWGRLIVDAGATLTVEPGVIVKVSAGGTMYVHGQLEARGTITEPIFFTSLQDDSVGGDTNGDGDATTPAPGDWYYVVAVGSGQAWVEQAEVRYAGQRDPYGQGYGALFANSADCSLLVTSTV